MTDYLFGPGGTRKHLAGTFSNPSKGLATSYCGRRLETAVTMERGYERSLDEKDATKAIRAAFRLPVCGLCKKIGPPR